MNAAELMRTVPLGAFIRYSDGTPRPPERFNKKLNAWKRSNGTGLLTGKSAASRGASGYQGGASFQMREAEYGTASTICLIVNIHHSEESAYDYEVLELPTGTVRINGQGELVPPQDIAARAGRGYTDPQRGETTEPAGYGAGYPTPINPTDELVLDLPGVKTYLRHRSLIASGSGTLIALRDDGYHIEFPGTFCRPIVETLDGMLDETARRFLLSLLKRREDGESLTQDDLRARVTA